MVETYVDRLVLEVYRKPTSTQRFVTADSFHPECHKNAWGAGQGMLLRIHEMFILSAPEYGSTAKDGKLKWLEPIHNRGLRIAFGAFCVCKTKNILCESGYEDEH
jgi:hypothetical protein